MSADSEQNDFILPVALLKRIEKAHAICVNQLFDSSM